MKSNDMHNNSRAVRSIDPVALTTVAGVAGKVVDRQGWGGVEFIFVYGATGASTADIPVVIKEGDVTGTMTSVADASLLGTEVLAGIPDGTARTSGVSKNVVKRVGYSGNKRYVSGSIGTVSAAMVTVANKVAGVCCLHNPSLAPTANP